MKLIDIGQIERYHKRLHIIIRVPAWKAWVARVAAQDTALNEAYAKYFMSCGMQSNKAWDEAGITIQKTYEQGYLEGLREAVARRSAEYAEMWPQLAIQVGVKRRHPIVILKGFDAAAVQQMYVPYQNTGRAGQDYVKEMLANMGRNAGG